MVLDVLTVYLLVKLKKKNNTENLNERQRLSQISLRFICTRTLARLKN